jgi:hypothetical protein
MRRAGWVWATANEVSDDGMASVGGEVVGDDRDDSGVGALGIAPPFQLNYSKRN